MNSFTKQSYNVNKESYAYGGGGKRGRDKLGDWD